MLGVGLVIRSDRSASVGAIHFLGGRYLAVLAASAMEAVFPPTIAQQRPTALYRAAGRHSRAPGPESQRVS